MTTNVNKYPLWKKVLSVLLALNFWWWDLSIAAPVGGNVAAGSAGISQSGTTTTINQTTQNVVINWQSFNTASNEAVNFIQPNANAAALNRINSGLPTQFFGSLNANGRVFIVNPAGVFFGASSRIDVGSILATTADIQNQNFMNGNYQFQQSAGSFNSVVNEGEIKANGFVGLVGPGVMNNGVIRANLGKVVLASGTSYTLDMYGDQLIQFATNSQVTQTPIGPDGKPMKSAVTNNGSIYADGGQVLLTANAAANVVENMIDSRGYIQAKSAYVGRDGSVILSGGNSGIVSVTGKISAHNVKVLGNKVAVTDNAQIESDGGEVLIGGNYRGQGPEQNAAQTYFGPNATIDNPNGKVIVWGTDTMQAYGTINAPGGFVETSGHRIDVSGINLNVGSGQWLLDPDDLYVVGTPPTSNVATSPNFFGNSGSGFNSYLYVGDLLSVLNGSGTVLISTFNNLGSVFIQTPIAKTSGGDMTFIINSGYGIQIDPGAAISSTSGKLNMNFTAFGGGIALGSNINANGGDVSLTASAGDINGAGGVIANTLTTNSSGYTLLNAGQNQVNNFNGTAGGDIVLDNGAPSGTLNITGLSVGGNLSVTNNGAITLAAVGSLVNGNATILSNGNILQSAGFSVLGTSTFDTRSALNATILLGSTGNLLVGPVALYLNNSNQSILLNNNAATQLGSGTISGADFTLNSGGAVTQNGPITVPGTLLMSSAGDTTLNDAGNNIGALNAATFFGGNFSLTNAASLTINALSVEGDAAITTTVGSIIGADFISISAANINFNAFHNVNLGQSAINTSGNVTLTAGNAVNNVLAGSITANTLSTNAGGFTQLGNLAVSNYQGTGNGIVLTNTGALNIIGISDTNLLNITNSGDITQSGAITVSGATTFTMNTPASDILLASQPNDFSGSINFSGTLSNIRDLALRSINAAASIPSLVGLTNLRNLTLVFDNAAIALPTFGNSGNLSITAGGAITQTGPLLVNGTSYFNAGANPITLDNFSNLFTGAVSLNNTGANDVMINASYTTPLIFDTSTIGGNLFATNGPFLANTAGGDIQQIGPLHVGGSALFNLIANYASGGGNITLTDLGNTFGGYVLMFTGNPNNATPPSTPKNASLVTAGDVFLGRFSIINGDLTVAPVNGGIYQQDSDILTQVGVAVTGTATFNAGNNEINLGYAEPSLSLLGNSFNNFSGPVIFNNTGASNNVQFLNSNALATNTILGASSIGGNLTVGATNPISQTGALTVGGTSSFTAGSNAIILTQANALTGAVSLNNSGNNNVTLTNSILLTMGASNVGNGTLSLTGAGITQIGAIVQAASAGAVTLITSAATTDILLGSQPNDFSGGVSLGGTLSNIRDFALRNINVAAAIPSLPITIRDLTLQFDNSAMALPTTTSPSTRQRRSPCKPPGR